jgi:hypothetical protein
MKKYNKYGLTAIRALEIYKTKNSLRDFWFSAASEFFESESSVNKGCPRSTFLGLYKEGLVKGIKSRMSLNNKKTNLNKNYAITAINILASSPTLSIKELWNEVKEALLLRKKDHNSQMDVVLGIII